MFAPQLSSPTSPFPSRRLKLINRQCIPLFFLFIHCFMLQTASSVSQLPDMDYPSKIELRAGAIHAPPFTYIIEEENDGEVDFRFEGFCPDLINRLTRFAEQDGVELDIQLEKAVPQNYFVALDLIADDCNTTSNPHPAAECNKYDMLIADYWSSPDRIMRVDMTPPFLRTAFTTVKYLDRQSTNEFTTISQVNQANESLCILNDSFVIWILHDEHPEANIVTCDSQDQCIEMLKNESCVLYFDEELQLRHAAVQDASLEVTIEKFFTQFIVWPFKYDAVDPTAALLLRRWMMAAVKNKTVEELYYNYFEKHACPLGYSGPDCSLPCNPNHGVDSRGFCVCESTRWTGPDCSVEVKENTNLIPPTLKLVGNIMVGINIAAAAICAMWLYAQRRTVQVRVIQPFFLAVVLVGCVISSSTIIALGQESSGDGPVDACMAIPWLYSVGFSITFGVLFAKIRRVYLIFKSAVNFNRKRVTIAETLGVVGAVLLIDLAILIVWTMLDPLQWERSVIQTDKFGYVLESEGHCTSSHWKIFGGMIALLHFSLMAFACYLCYVSRAIPTEFSEGKYVAIAMISNLQIFVVGIPVLVILGSDPQTSYFVRSIIIWMNDFVVLALIFGNLMYSVHFAPPDDGTNSTSLGSAIQKFSLTASQQRKSESRVHKSATPRSSFTSAPNEKEQNNGNSSNNSDRESVRDVLKGFTKSELYRLEEGNMCEEEDSDCYYSTTNDTNSNNKKNQSSKKTGSIKRWRSQKSEVSDESSWALGMLNFSTASPCNNEFTDRLFTTTKKKPATIDANTTTRDFAVSHLSMESTGGNSTTNGQQAITDDADDDDDEIAPVTHTDANGGPNGGVLVKNIDHCFGIDHLVQRDNEHNNTLSSMQQQQLHSGQLQQLVQQQQYLQLQQQQQQEQKQDMMQQQQQQLLLLQQQLQQLQLTLLQNQRGQHPQSDAEGTSHTPNPSASKSQNSHPLYPELVASRHRRDTSTTVSCSVVGEPHNGTGEFIVDKANNKPTETATNVEHFSEEILYFE